MDNIYIKIGAAILLALVLSLVATPLVKRFAQRVGAVDVPKDARRVHKKPIPLLGGIAIFIGFVISVLLFADIDRQIRGILIGAVVVVIIGVIDDFKPLKAWLKFIVQIIAALIAVYHGVVIDILSNPLIFSAEPYLNLGVFAYPITVLWIVLITNSVNFIDGLDGLAAGVSTISSVVMLIIAMLVPYPDPNVAIIMAALAGACIGFIPYNFNPAKIFMGDAGALLLGFILATVSVMGMFKFYAAVSFAVPLLVLALPLFDTCIAALRRILNGKKPWAPDRGHFHHRLIDMGLSQKQAVAVLYAISGLLAIAAVVVTTSGEIRAIILIVAVVIAAAIIYFAYRGAHPRTVRPASDAEEIPEELAKESEDEPVQVEESIESPENTAEEDVEEEREKDVATK
ncbi:MAG: undecaprenyl/decaprenyl-phosphate alpha-N-acetylglucosaminyl 1-phosphate transferase [Oscillospiraceae bacterium]|nr:undecaprenyl/decaprenyl-phosphate alpha-N-acetylglucosaminyl 1-phosphate transferase [Oscillospiraceae bacterium]